MTDPTNVVDLRKRRRARASLSGPELAPAMARLSGLADAYQSAQPSTSFREFAKARGAGRELSVYETELRRSGKQEALAALAQRPVLGGLSGLGDDDAATIFASYGYDTTNEHPENFLVIPHEGQAPLIANPTEAQYGPQPGVTYGALMTTSGQGGYSLPADYTGPLRISAKDNQEPVVLTDPEDIAANVADFRTRDQQAIVKLAALMVTAGVASAMTGAAAATTAGTVDELAPIVVTAEQIIPTAEVAAAGAAMGLPTVAEIAASVAGGAPMLSIPALANIAPEVLQSVTADIAQTMANPAVQTAIDAGALPSIPTTVTGGAFRDWAVSAGVSQVEKQLGRLLTPQEQQGVEQQLAAEVARLQQQLAQNSPGSGLVVPQQGAMLDGGGSWWWLLVALGVGVGVFALSQE